MTTVRRQAFTLIELLATMAILGLLMAILLPSLSASRQQAKASVCLSTLKGIGTSVQVYLNENKDQFFPFRQSKITPESTEVYINHFRRQAPRWHWFLETEMGPVISPDPFKRFGEAGFGDDGLFLRGVNADIGRRMSIDLFTCPTLDDPAFSHDIRNGAYGYNYQYLGNTRTDTDPSRWDNFAVGLHKIKSTPRTVLIGDSRGSALRGHGLHSYTLDPPRLATEAGAQRFGPDVDDVVGLNAQDMRAFSPVEARHRGRANVVFVDGHAEAMTPLDLGYEINGLEGHMSVPDLPAGLTLPRLDLTAAPSPIQATNKLFNGLGRDPIWEAANRTGG